VKQGSQLSIISQKKELFITTAVKTSNRFQIVFSFVVALEVDINILKGHVASIL
jgi:hypothetical protein